uniref:Nucleoside-triphosphatase, cancer-related n=1 Tax=Cercocebus atys TaxID=9531 RepID=A0A2K5ND52_CERAT
MARHVFLTGPPGVGKTTLIQKASEVLKSSGVPVDGFYTEEVRQGGRRIGFDVVTLSGTRGPLSRVGLEPPPGKRECRVGQYVVDMTSFEHLALPVLRNADCSSGPGQRVCVIDEIGKMELFSQPFIQAVRQTLSTPGTIILGTIPVPKGKPLALVEEIRNRKDVKVFNSPYCVMEDQSKFSNCVSPSTLTEPGQKLVQSLLNSEWTKRAPVVPTSVLPPFCLRWIPW